MKPLEVMTKKHKKLIASSLLLAMAVPVLSFADAVNVEYPAPSPGYVYMSMSYSGQYCKQNTAAIVGYGPSNAAASCTSQITTTSTTPSLCPTPINWTLSPCKSTCLPVNTSALPYPFNSSNTSVTAGGTGTGNITISYVSGSAIFYATVSNLKAQACPQVVSNGSIYLLYNCGPTAGGNPNRVSCCYTTNGQADADCNFAQ